MQYFINDENYHMKFGSYYQAQVDPPQGWFFVGVLRSFEHLAFDRTLDVATSTFEFFVPQDNELFFVDLMNYFINKNIISDLKKLPNRLMKEGEAI